MMESDSRRHYDVVILGAGIAGLALARQLLMVSGKRVLLLEKRSQVPSPRQKVGEATVQVSAYYFSKVLDLEEHLLRDHLMKYNLRFYWKTPGRNNDCFEDYSQSYVGALSNIATYQLDRNKIETELLRLNSENPNFTFCPGILNLDVALSPSEEPHSFLLRPIANEWK
jgi:2-polyprenyl-6-methoxyphenol hydroxylase-like FAD-dependent oxidoreductase